MASRAELSAGPDTARHAEAPQPPGGAAVELDDLDRRLLNLMQGSFPIARASLPARRRPGRGDGFGEADAMARVQRLLDAAHHPPGHPDLRHQGARLLLDAGRRQGRPEHPHRAAQVINAHPGVSHNYLRNHEFNLWFTIATPPDSKLGLDGTLEVLAREAGRRVGAPAADAAAVQDPHGPRNGGRHAGARERRRRRASRSSSSPSPTTSGTSR